MGALHKPSRANGKTTKSVTGPERDAIIAGRLLTINAWVAAAEDIVADPQYDDDELEWAWGSLNIWIGGTVPASETTDMFFVRRRDRQPRDPDPTVTMDDARDVAIEMAAEVLERIFGESLTIVGIGDTPRANETLEHRQESTRVTWVDGGTHAYEDCDSLADALRAALDRTETGEA